MSPKRSTTKPALSGKESHPKPRARAEKAAKPDRRRGRSSGKVETRPSGDAGGTIDWSNLDENLTNQAADLALRAFTVRIAFGGTVAAQRREKTPERRQAEIEEYWSVVSPARNNAMVAEHRWIAAVRDGDPCRRLIEGIASAGALKAAFEARAAILLNHRVCAEAAWATDDLARPLVELLERNRQTEYESAIAESDETREQALDRYVAAVKGSGEDALAELSKHLQPRDDVNSRLKRLRRSPEWLAKRGALSDLSSRECVNLFRNLLISTAVYDKSRDALAKIVVLRKNGRAIQRAIDSLGHIVGLSREQSDAFGYLLEVIAPEGETDPRHHKKPTALRVFTIDLILSALIPHWRNKNSAIEMFSKEPRSTGIASLASAAINETVTTVNVRDALKRWKQDKSNRLVL